MLLTKDLWHNVSKFIPVLHIYITSFKNIIRHVQSNKFRLNRLFSMPPIIRLLAIL